MSLQHRPHPTIICTISHVGQFPHCQHRPRPAQQVPGCSRQARARVTHLARRSRCWWGSLGRRTPSSPASPGHAGAAGAASANRSQPHRPIFIAGCTFRLRLSDFAPASSMRSMPRSLEECAPWVRNEDRVRCRLETALVVVTCLFHHSQGRPASAFSARRRRTLHTLRRPLWGFTFESSPGSLQARGGENKTKLSHLPAEIRAYHHPPTAAFGSELQPFFALGSKPPERESSLTCMTTHAQDA